VQCRGSGRCAKEPPPQLPPLVQEALDLVGGPFGLRDAEEPSVVRGQLARAYRNLRARQVRQASVRGLPPMLPAGEQRAQLESPHAA